MRKKSILNWVILILVTGSIFFVGCNKNNEEEGLGASRPIPNMLFPISELGLYTTEWYGTNSNDTLVINFDRTDCTFTVKEHKTGKKTMTKYNYTYNHPVVTLTPENENEGVLKGKTLNGRSFDADEMTFVDAKDNPVWMRVLRRK